LEGVFDAQQILRETSLISQASKDTTGLPEADYRLLVWASALNFIDDLK
jgi:hypothetical protein